MTDRSLSTGELAVLGVLTKRPMHGYEMARYFDRDDLTEICPIEQSMLYTHIRKVEERGLVSWSEERVGLRPPRKTYALTDAGRDVLHAWLETPVERMRQIRLEFLLKLYFLHDLDPLSELELLRRQIEICQVYQGRLKLRANTSEGFSRLVAMSKQSAAEATLQWLRSYCAELQQERSTMGLRS